jgi:ferritin-like metal-binding protein YciE
MFSTKKIRISRALYGQLVEKAQRSGYSSTDEMITHILQQEVARNNDDHDQKLAEEQLRGLGYIE